MDNSDIFVRILLTDKVKLRPSQISTRLKEHLITSLRQKFEGTCSYHGFIKPNSIEIFKYSLGTIQALSLNGDVEYMVQYNADVCNPSIGSVVHTKIVNTNKFGVLAHTGITDENARFLPILEIVVAKNMVNAQNDRNVEDLKVGDEIHVEIIGKKFELSDKKISVVARIINTDNDRNILDAGVNGAEVDGEDEPEDEDEADGGSETDSSDEGEENDDGNDGNEANEEEEDNGEDIDEDIITSEPDSDDEVASQLGGELGSDGFFSGAEEALSDFGGSDAGASDVE